MAYDGYLPRLDQVSMAGQLSSLEHCLACHIALKTEAIKDLLVLSFGELFEMHQVFGKELKDLIFLDPCTL